MIEESNVAEEKIPVLVTGAAGFTGQHMVEYLLSRTDPKYEVFGTDLKKPKDPHCPTISFFEKDLTKADELCSDDFLEVLQKVKIIFHIAGIFNYAAPAENLMMANVRGTQNFFNALVKSGNKPRVIHWGAAGILGSFGHLASLPATEDMSPRTDDSYLLSKWLGEYEALNYWLDFGIPVTVIRPSAVYGPRSRYGMALSILLVGQGKLPPMTVGSGKNRGALVHVYDVVGAAEYLARHEKAVGEVFQVTADCKYTISDITRHLAKLFGIPFIPWLKIPAKLLYWIVDKISEKSKKLGVKMSFDRELVRMIVTNSWLSNEKLKQFGYQFQFPDALEGLTQTVAWYKKEGWV